MMVNETPTTYAAAMEEAEYIYIYIYIYISRKNVNTNLKVGYLECQGERKLKGLCTSV